MKLNLDCIRDILLEVEKFSTFQSVYSYNPDNLPDDSFLSAYTYDEVLYHVRQASLSGLLLNVNWTVFDYVGIEDLTPAGHEFLANIRNNSIWKQVLKKCSGASLSVVMKFAEKLACEVFLR